MLTGSPPVGTASTDGPWNQRVLLANSNDGLIWKVSGEVLAEQSLVASTRRIGQNISDNEMKLRYEA